MKEARRKASERRSEQGRAQWEEECDGGRIVTRPEGQLEGEREWAVRGVRGGSEGSSRVQNTRGNEEEEQSERKGADESVREDKRL